MLTQLLVAAVCHVAGVAPFVRPDDACTPGAYDNLPRAQVCIHRPRPSLPRVERIGILISYGVPDWKGGDGELDHRVPFFLGGTTDWRNIWPEAGSRPNAKDTLEFYVYRRVCLRAPYPMRIRTARALFTGDWVVAFRKYHLT